MAATPSESRIKFARKHGYRYVGKGVFRSSANVYSAFIEGLRAQKSNEKNVILPPVK